MPMVMDQVGDGAASVLLQDAALAEFVAAECARLKVPGCAVGVVVGEKSFGCGIGVTDVDHPLPVDTDTLFLIGSTTKTLTATTMMTLVQDGTVALDEPVITYLPELELEDEAARASVTVAQLLDHSAGWRGDIEVQTGWGEDALARALPEVAATVPQLFAPGSMTSYNNLALVVAGRLIERVTGDSYEQAVRTRVLGPLAMTDTFFQPWEVATRKLATGHVVQDGKPRPAYSWPLSRGIAPAGGAVSTVRDQLRYARFHLDGIATGIAPFGGELRTLMQQPRSALPSVLSGVGLSWLLRDRDGLSMVTHGGNCSNLYVSAFALAPTERFAVTVLTNGRGGGAVGASVTEWAVQHYLQRPAVSSPVPLAMSPELRADYVGRYDAGQWDLEVTDSDGKLFVQMLITDVPPDTPAEVLAAFAAPPSEVVLVGPDVIAPAGSPADSAGDFVRDTDGRVAWLRYGLRLARRRP